MTSKSTDDSSVPTDRSFIFVACNPRSQSLCKNEIARTWPELSPSFSRPGLLTYKGGNDFPPRFDLSLTFARTFGWSLSPLNAESIDELTKVIVESSAAHSADHVHIWSREWVDHTKDEKSESDIGIEKLSESLAKSAATLALNEVARADERVLNVIWIAPHRWWLGWHIAGSIPQRWSGGVPSLKVPQSMVSRAYLKTSEALQWSGIQIKKGDVCAEIGSAPGGSCQRLLELGAAVIAIDPADLDPSIAKHAQVTHLKMRGRDVPHRQLSSVSWLLVDSTVTPNHTLDTVEALATGKQTHFRGLLLTLKFTKPAMADELEKYVERVRSWGFRFVKTRQLAYGRQEVCLMALKQKSVRRFRS